MKLMKRIGFWKKDTGNYLTAKSGLTQADIDALHSLKVGDRLILYVGGKKLSEQSPDANLTTFLVLPKDNEEL